MSSLVCSMAGAPPNAAPKTTSATMTNHARCGNSPMTSTAAATAYRCPCWR